MRRDSRSVQSNILGIRINVVAGEGDEFGGLHSVLIRCCEHSDWCCCWRRTRHDTNPKWRNSGDYSVFEPVSLALGSTLLLEKDALVQNLLEKDTNTEERCEFGRTAITFRLDNECLDSS